MKSVNALPGTSPATCRVAPDGAPLNLHRMWDGLLTSSNNIGQLGSIATELRNNFPRPALSELASMESEVWARESFEIATKIAYRNGRLPGTPKGSEEIAAKSRRRLCCQTAMQWWQERSPSVGSRSPPFAWPLCWHVVYNRQVRRGMSG